MKAKLVQETVTDLIAKLGENMAVRRFEKFTVENGAIAKLYSWWRKNWCSCKA